MRTETLTDADDAWADPSSISPPRQINVALEELKALGSPVSWVGHTIDISRNVQKEPWFVNEINPNGRIPAIVDYSRGSQRVFETGSILLYLKEWYDGERFLLHFEDDADETEMVSWIFFQHGGYGASRWTSSLVSASRG